MSENLKNTTDKKTPDRVIAYVDGYNLYCSVRDKWKGNPNLVKYHLKKLVLRCLKEINKETKIENLKKIKFYTARPLLPEDIPPKMRENHYSVDHYEQWIERQKKLDNEIIEGVYRIRHSKYFLEKQTDVNLAVDMLSDAYEEHYDTAVLISNDTDYCRLILKCLRLKKQVLVLGAESHIKSNLCEERPYSSECEQYINNGKLIFYLIEKNDIEKSLDKKYIKRTRNNQSSDKKIES